MEVYYTLNTVSFLQSVFTCMVGVSYEIEHGTRPEICTGSVKAACCPFDFRKLTPTVRHTRVLLGFTGRFVCCLLRPELVVLG